MDGIVGVVLAAGRGTRLRPLTRLRPKALCPVGNVPLVDLALERVRPAVDAVAVNLHHGRRTLDLHLRRRRAPLGRGGRAPRHRRRARAPPAVDRRARRARGERRRLVPRLAGAVRRRAGTASGSACCSPAATSCGPTSAHRRRADAVGGRGRRSSRSRRASTRCRGGRPQAAGRLEVVRHDGPFVDCGTPAAVPGRQPAGQRRRERGRARRAWSRARSTGAWCGATPACTPASRCSCCDPRPRPRHRARALTLELDALRRLVRRAVARSWPQAASMSVPRVRRTVAFTPPARSSSRNSRTRCGGRAPHRVARRGVERDQVHVGGQREAPRPLDEQLRRPASRSLTPSISAHSNDRRRPLASEVAGAGVHQRAQRVAPVDRHELVAQLVVGGVERHGQVHRQRLGRPAGGCPGTMPDGRHREVAGRRARGRRGGARPPPTSGRSWRAARPCP